MLRTFISAFLIGLAAAPAVAQDNVDWRFGGDAYLGGRTVVVNGGPIGDLFAAGQNVTAAVDITGSAHMAGQNVDVEGRVGQNLYGAGQDVTVNGPVAGNVTVVGQDVTLSEPVSGNVRATGQTVELQAPVAGNVILAGDHATIDAEISGDLALAVQSVEWGDAAKVGGEVHVYTDDPDGVEVPANVAASDKVFVHEMKQFDEATGMPGMDRPSFWQRLRGWIGGVVVVGLLGTVFAAVAPEYLTGAVRLRTPATGRLPPSSALRSALWWG